jgi:hypothetical protein
MRARSMIPGLARAFAALPLASLALASLALASLALASLALASCGAPPAPATPAYCPEGCAEGLHCYAPTEECVLDGVGTCEPSCASYEQCSVRAPEPTCFAQICTLPPAPPTPLLKVFSLALLPAAEGCDLDADGEGDAELTALQEVYADLPQALTNAIAADRITVFLSREAERLDLLFGTLAPESLRCDPSNATAGCRYTITRESYDRGARSGPCPAWLSLDGASLDGSAYTAGGPDTNAGISVPIEAQQFLLQAYGLRADGALTQVEGADSAMTLRLCGALPKAELSAALEGLPADSLAPVGGLESARSLLDLILDEDIDGDRDGTPESVSFALEARAVRADTVGWSPPVARTAP